MAEGGVRNTLSRNPLNLKISEILKQIQKHRIDSPENLERPTRIDGVKHQNRGNHDNHETLEGLEGLEYLLKYENLGDLETFIKLENVQQTYSIGNS